MAQKQVGEKEEVMPVYNFVASRGFACPTCDVPANVMFIKYRDNGEIYLTGFCPKCKAGVAVELNVAIKAIMDAARKREN